MARYLRATPSYFEFQPFVSTLAVDDLSYTPSAAEKTRDDAQLAATGRRNWKTLRGKGEAVWPPQLEAALLEALEKYKPDEARSLRSGRFPLRNKFISEYILGVTGKHRTPKQVGSRLQQLRDTCKNDRLLELICPPRFFTWDNSSHSDCENSPIESRLSSTPPLSNQTWTANTRVWVRVNIETAGWPRPAPVIPLFNNEAQTPLTVSLSPLPINSVSGAGLGSLDSEVSFASSSPLMLQSSCAVFQDGVPICRERVPLTPLSTQESGWTYVTKLVPGFWKTLCDDPRPTRFTIVQDLMPVYLDGEKSSNTTGSVVSVIYNFSYPDTVQGLGVQTQCLEMFKDESSPTSNLSLSPIGYDLQHVSYDSGWYEPVASNVMSHSFGVPFSTESDYSPPPSISKAAREQKSFSPCWETGLVQPIPLHPQEYYGY
ncbi:hypothetical protein C8J56DRAFT_1161962 [Mycena floridula]|nr:hypothetical protein C8J56DRAFT_1161962 [Mycena floridula]